MDAKNVGRFITALRTEKGIRPEALAAGMRVNVETVLQWERGVGYPSIEQFPELARLLGTTTDELFRGAQVVRTGVDTTKSIQQGTGFASSLNYSRNLAIAPMIISVVFACVGALWFLLFSKMFPTLVAMFSICIAGVCLSWLYVELMIQKSDAAVFDENMYLVVKIISIIGLTLMLSVFIDKRYVQSKIFDTKLYPLFISLLQAAFLSLTYFKICEAVADKPNHKIVSFANNKFYICFSGVVVILLIALQQTCGIVLINRYGYKVLQEQAVTLFFVVMFLIVFVKAIPIIGNKKIKLLILISLAVFIVCHMTHPSYFNMSLKFLTENNMLKTNYQWRLFYQAAGMIRFGSTALFPLSLMSAAGSLRQNGGSIGKSYSLMFMCFGIYQIAKTFLIDLFLPMFSESTNIFISSMGARSVFISDVIGVILILIYFVRVRKCSQTDTLPEQEKVLPTTNLQH